MTEPTEAGPSPPHNLIVIAVLFEGGLGVVAAVLGWLFKHPPLDLAQWRLSAVGWGALGSIPPLLLFVASVRFPVGPLAHLLRIVEETLVPMFARSNLIDLALVSLLAGLGEEMLFRGLIQVRVAAMLGGAWGPWIGLTVAGVLFAAAHWITLTYAVIAGVIGLYLGWLMLATGNLLIPITAHAVYDFVALIYLVKIRRPRTAESP